MIAGLETNDLRQDRHRRAVVNEVEPGRARHRHGFQNYALYPHMSVYNNMAYGLRNRRMPGK